MEQLDYIIILLYFLGLIAVSVVMSRKIKNSEDMFIAGRNSSWWLSGVSSYMTIFSASTFVVWGGVAYKSGLVAVVVALCLGVASFIVGKWISGKWRELRIKSPGEFHPVRTSHGKFLHDFRNYSPCGTYGSVSVCGSGCDVCINQSRWWQYFCKYGYDGRFTDGLSKYLVGASYPWCHRSWIHHCRRISCGTND